MAEFATKPRKLLAVFIDEMRAIGAAIGIVKPRLFPVL